MRKVLAVEVDDKLGEKIIDTTEFSETLESNDDDSNEEKVETLAEIICRAGDEVAAALFVLMGTLETSMHPKVLANAGNTSPTHAARSRTYTE